MKKLLFPLLLLAVLALFPLAARADGLTLYLDGAEVSGEATVDMTARPTFQMTATEPVTWKSSWKSRLQVDETGLCTPQRTGYVALTARSASGEEAVVRLYLTRGVQEIRLSGAQEMGEGQSQRLSSQVLPSNASDRGLVWSSSDPSVLTVNAYGTVKAQKVDAVRQATITARAKDGLGAQAEFTITVRPAARSMTLYLDDQPVNGQTLSLNLAASDRTLRLRAVVEPADAVQTVTWSTSSRTRATIEDGLVTGLKNGTVTLTATSTADKRVKATCKLSLSTLVSQVSLSGPTVMTSGQSGKLTASILPANASNRKLVYASSDPSVLTINKYGNLRAQPVSARREAIVTAAAQDGSGVVGSLRVVVCPSPQSVTLTLDGQPVNGESFALDLAGENRLLLSASVLPGDASQSITWVSSNKNIATVSDGLIIGQRRGTVTLTAYSDDKKVRAVCRVTVSTLAHSVLVSGPDGVSSGKSIRLTASVQPSDATSRKVVWSSDNPSAARVNASGTVTGLDVPAITAVTIRATAQDGGGAFGERQVLVYPRPQSVELSMDGGALPNVLFLDSASAGSTRTVQARVYPADAAQSLKWSSSNARVARVDQNGCVTCVSEGRAIITVRSSVESGVERSFWVVCGNYSEMPYYIEVDKANQVVRVYERGDGSYTHLIRRMICSSGASGTNFRNGLYCMSGSRIQWCSAGHDSIYMQYATRISGSYMFHGVPTIGAAGNRVKNSWYQKLGSRDSGGCIRLLTADAKWIFENVPSDTFVLVMQGVRDANEYGSVSAPPSGQTGAYIWDPTDDNPENPYYDPTYSSLVE